jgi:carbamoyl-phosphate synthase large subunit
MSVAVTAVGGVIGQGIIKALQNTEYSVVGINSEVLGAGLYATKKSYIGLNSQKTIFLTQIRSKYW